MIRARLESVRNHVQMLVDMFGARFLALLFVIHFCAKGILFVVTNASMLPLFKARGATASELQLYAAIAMSPWAMKPLIGVCSDLIPIGTYHKRYWMLIGCAFGLFGAFMLILQMTPASVMVVFFFCLHLEISILDLLSEGKYSEYMKSHPETGSTVVTFVQSCQNLAQLIALSFVGAMSDASLYQPLFLIGLIMAAAPVLFISLGWLPESRRHPGETGMRGNKVVMLDGHRLRSEWRILCVVAAAGVCSPIIATLTTYVSRPVGLVCAFVALVGCVSGGFYVFSPLIARVALFQVLSTAGRLSVSSALSYFYTASPECLPDGPHFSYTYYITYSGLVASVVSLLFTLAYPYLFGDWKFRRVILFSTVLGFFSGGIDMAIVLRRNTHVFGISDRVFYILGEAIVENLIVIIFWIPTSTIIGKVCPPGLESAVYAFIAGLANLGAIVADLSGAWAIEVSGLRSVLPDCNWAPLPWLVLFGHIVIPTAIGLPAILLLPDARQTDALGDDTTVDARRVAEIETELDSVNLDAMTDTETSEEFQPVYL